MYAEQVESDTLRECKKTERAHLRSLWCIKKKLCVAFREKQTTRSSRGSQSTSFRVHHCDECGNCAQVTQSASSLLSSTAPTWMSTSSGQAPLYTQPAPTGSWALWGSCSSSVRIVGRAIRRPLGAIAQDFYSNVFMRDVTQKSLSLLKISDVSLSDIL